jgi:hypothetical protein
MESTTSTGAQGITPVCMHPESACRESSAINEQLSENRGPHLNRWAYTCSPCHVPVVFSQPLFPSLHGISPRPTSNITGQGTAAFINLLILFDFIFGTLFVYNKETLHDHAKHHLEVNGPETKQTVNHIL